MTAPLKRKPSPKQALARALSRHLANCPSPSTPRLNVFVPQALQKTFFPWLKDLEKALDEHKFRDHRAKNDALRDFFSLMPWCWSLPPASSAWSPPRRHRHLRGGILRDPWREGA